MNENLTINQKEEWKDIKDYEGLYQVSNLGNVRSLDKEIIRKNNFKSIKIKGRILKQQNCGGYKVVPLCKNGKECQKKIHRLVAEAFIENPNNLPIINHKDENKSNNVVENLEWCNSKYNSNYGTCIERRVKASSRPLYQIDRYNGTIVAEWDGANYAKKALNLKYSDNILYCCKKKTYLAYNYIWRYKDEYDKEEISYLINIINSNNKIPNPKRKVIQLDLDGNIIDKWISITEVQRCLNYKKSFISDCCRGKQKSAYGYRWQYAEDYYKNKSL